MKKILFLFAALCLTQAGIVMAADTDLTAYSNVIYVASATINPSVNGNETTLSIRMNNTAQIRGFQFDLYLPEGMTAVKSSKGKFAVSLNKARLAKDDEHTLTVATQSDGAIRFLCGSQYDETFTGTSGEIATIKVNVAGLKAGKYPITLKAVKLCETNINNYYEVAEIVTTFTVSYTKYLQDRWIQSISDQTYTGKALKPTVTVKDGKTKLTQGTDYTVVYSNNINAGTATVTVTAKKGSGYDGKATATFTIAKADITMTTAPAAIENLLYTGEAQTLISAGEASFGNVLYSLDGNTYSEDLPTAIEPGTYTIYYKVEGDDNHNAFAAQTVSVTIATNKTALNSTISEAEGYYDTFKESYPDIADALLQAINAAKTVQANADATQQEIETATTNLKGAIEEAKAAAEQAANQAAANAVIAKIADIGEVAYTDECKALIDAAREAYDALTDTQKELVTNDEVLTDAEATYAALKAAADQAAAEQAAAEQAAAEQAAANQAAADAVIAKIADIGEVTYTNESKALIDASREAYDALTDTQKELVTNYNVLTDAEATYADLKTAADQAAAEQAANQAAANAVIAKIADIGEVAYTDECKALIDAAREAYDALTETQKELVANYNVLTDAEKTYADLEAYTGINDTPVNDAIKEKGWYDMNGHRLAGKPTVKGMYVKDGKKVIITF